MRIRFLSVIALLNGCIAPSVQPDTTREADVVAGAAVLADAPEVVLLVEDPGEEEAIFLGDNGGIDRIKVSHGGLLAAEQRAAAQIPEAQRIQLAQQASATDCSMSSGQNDAAQVALQAALTNCDPGALIDGETPRDGHCLIHALKAGGLLNDIPGGLTVSELRRLALSRASAEQLEIAAQSADQSVAVYLTGMKAGQHGDELMLQMLAEAFCRSISVISVSAARTFTPMAKQWPQSTPMLSGLLTNQSSTTSALFGLALLVGYQQTCKLEIKSWA